MRKLIGIFVALVCAQLYTYLSLRTPPAEPPPAQVAIAPVQPPKLYYHSPLEAPAMTATAYTSMGYFSTDPDARFDSAHARMAAVQANAVSSNTGLNWGDENERADIQKLQSVYKLPRTGVAATLGGRVPASAYAAN